MALIVPLAILGLWCADSGYKYLLPSHYNGYCTMTGNCNGFESDEDQLFRAASGGIYLGGIATGALLEGGLNDRIILAESNTPKTLILPPNAKGDSRGCDLEYSERLSHSEFVDGAMKVVRSVDDVFILNCGAYSQPEFRFANKELHNALVSAFQKHHELKSEFYEKQKRLAIAAFFVPFAVFFGAWALISVLAGLFRFVRFGRNPA